MIDTQIMTTFPQTGRPFFFSFMHFLLRTL